MTIAIRHRSPQSETPTKTIDQANTDSISKPYIRFHKSIPLLTRGLLTEMANS